MALAPALQGTFYGPDNDFFPSAFINPLTGAYEVTVNPASTATSLVLDQPVTGYSTKIVGSGLTWDASGTITGGTIYGVVFEKGGSVVFEFTGVSWYATAFQAAVAAINTDPSQIVALLSMQLVMLDASPAVAPFLFNGTGWASDIMMLGSDHDDIVKGGKGNDLLEGGAGNDALQGAGGNDTVKGGDGRDILAGGRGNDKVQGGNGRDLITGFRGDDRLSGGNHADAIDGGDGNDRIAGGKGRDSLAGGQGNDLIFGDAHGDLINGGGGSDLIDGGRGNDTVSGGAGADEIQGGGGNDLLDGGRGDDLIIGGAGADIFHFRKQAGNDLIIDFEDGIDMLDVSSLGLTAGDIAIAATGTDTMITLGFHGSVVLAGIDATLISVADDFILA